MLCALRLVWEAEAEPITPSLTTSDKYVIVVYPKIQTGKTALFFIALGK